MAVAPLLTKGLGVFGDIASLIWEGLTAGAAITATGYAPIQTAALAVLRKLDEFDETNSAENDFRILANGKEYQAILTRGATNNRSMQEVPANGVYDKRSDRTVVIEIFVRINIDTLTARSVMNTITQTILDHFDKWPNLDQTAGIVETDADITNRPEDYSLGAVHYLKQRIPLNVIELEPVTLA